MVYEQNSEQAGRQAGGRGGGQADKEANMKKVHTDIRHRENE